jgi:hypothetical protein
MEPDWLRTRSTWRKRVRRLIFFGGLALIPAFPAFAQFEGGVNGLGDARQINQPTSEALEGYRQAAPTSAMEEDETPAPAAPVKSKKKATRH